MRADVLLKEAESRYLRALDTQALGREMRIFDEVDSTNAYLLSLGADAENLCCAALRQSAGRGRLGRSWASGGGGLYFSFCVKAETPDLLLLLPLAAACAVLDAFREAGIEGAGVKWPNDILIEEKKLVGILCQSRGAYAVTGIGVNIAQSAADFASAELPNAASLAMFGHAPDRWALCARIVTHAERRIVLVREGKTDALLSDYRACCVSLGRRLIAVKADGEIRGVGADVDEKGRLVLETEDGRIAVDSGEVKLRGEHGYV